jgi:CRP/FNR family cyclic AMP-dependent transcriptional regulator
MSKCDTSLLAGVPLFADLSVKELRDVAALAKLVHYADGEVIVEEDTAGARFFVLQSGTARVVRNGRTRATLGPGAYFGELAVLDGGPRSASVLASSPIEAWSIASFNFRALVTAHPKIASKLLVHLAERLRDAERSDVT